MADQLFQTFPRVLRPLFATLPLFTTFFVCRISLVVNIVKGCRLSMHCYDVHRDTFSFDCFKFGIVKKTKPSLLDREEARFCTKFRTNVWGLNRMEIKR